VAFVKEVYELCCWCLGFVMPILPNPNSIQQFEGDHQRSPKRFKRDMASLSPNLLEPLSHPHSFSSAKPRSPKRVNLGVNSPEGVVGRGGEDEEREKGGKEEKRAGKEEDISCEGESGGKWPWWANAIFRGKDDPGAEFRYIYNLTSESVSREDLQKCYKSAYQNKKKNRYLDVLPYEHTRVKLQSHESESDDDERGRHCSNDYINASFVQGVLGYRYIATQAPLQDTVGDFWRMVWEQEISTVVMLTRIVEAKKIKAIRYWPSQIGEVVVFGDFCLTLKSEKIHPCGHICLRKMKLERKSFGTSRLITHLHYTEWPDYGLPRTTEALRILVHLTEALNHSQIKSHKRRRDFKESDVLNFTPIVVHCSAGIGRAGTFIATHQTVKQIEAKIEEVKRERFQKAHSGTSHLGPPLEVKSIQDLVLKMREQRRGMVQTKEQYCFIYQVGQDALADLLCHNTPTEDTVDPLRLSWASEGKAVAEFLRDCNLDDSIEVEEPQVFLRKSNLIPLQEPNRPDILGSDTNKPIRGEPQDIQMTSDMSMDKQPQQQSSPQPQLQPQPQPQQQPQQK